jgi:hypothetical protein
MRFQESHPEYTPNGIECLTHAHDEATLQGFLIAMRESHSEKIGKLVLSILTIGNFHRRT